MATASNEGDRRQLADLSVERFQFVAEPRLPEKRM